MKLRLGLCCILLLVVVTSTAFGAVPSSFDEGWIAVQKIAANLYRFTECNAYSYLLIGDKEAVLIDAGYGVGNLRELCAAITPLPISVINTHGHVDHVGSDHYFERVYIHAKDAPMIENGLDLESKEWAVGAIIKNNPPSHFDPVQYTDPPVKPYQLLQGGETLQFGDIKLKVIWTPGHTQGSICLLEPTRRMLFVGDTMVFGQMWIFMPESDVNQWITSAETISKLSSKVDLVLPGHSKMLNAYDLEDLADVAAAVRDSKAEPDSQGICRAGAYGFTVLFRRK